MATTLDLRTQDGGTSGTVTLDETIFGIEPNMAVLHQVVTAQLAAKRSGSANTKTRAEVRGGGAKPYAQKGTGRARQGSIRAPQFTGGGIVHGPKPRSFRKKVNKKMNRLALCSALSDRAQSDRVVVVDQWQFETPKTKDALAALKNLELNGKIMMVVAEADEKTIRSFRNLPTVQLVRAAELNAYDVLCSDWLVFTSETLPGAFMKDPRDVVIAPVVSEKSYEQLEKNVYVFKVQTSASKPEIRNAIESIFDVTVTKVNTLNRKGKVRRNRRNNTLGKRADTKRAIVTLAEGDSIQIFET